MSQVMSCLFTIHIDDLMGLEVPIHKRWKHVMNFDVFLSYYRYINVDVPKVLKMSPHFQRWLDKCPLIFESLAEHWSTLISVSHAMFLWNQINAICQFVDITQTHNPAEELWYTWKWYITALSRLFSYNKWITFTMVLLESSVINIKAEF